MAGRSLESPPLGLFIRQSDRAYKNPCGPFDEKSCVMCGAPIGSGESSVGVRIDNPNMTLQIVGGPEECRSDGCHFNVHIGISCLNKAMREVERMLALDDQTLSGEALSRALWNEDEINQFVDEVIDKVDLCECGHPLSIHEKDDEGDLACRHKGCGCGSFTPKSGIR